MSHLVADDTPSSTPTGPWLKLSAALTECVAEIAERRDLLVRCAPGAGRGAPGCFVRARASIELDGAHLGADPRTCDPSRPSDRDRYSALWGVLVHEAAHADHTVWEVPAGSSDAAASAALMLEEARIEAVHLGRRPGDRHWVRAAIRTLVLADFSDAAMTRWDAAQAAGLLLARVDTGVLDADETATVTAVVEKLLSRTRLTKLRRIWRRAHKTADDDATRMLELGRRWCKALGIAPDRSAPERGARAPGQPSPLTDAITAVLDAVGGAGGPATTGATPDRAAARAAERAARERTRMVASRVFTSTEVAAPNTSTPLLGVRPPSIEEQAAARRLARALRAAAHRERVTTTINSASPPGRLRMREALAADAQRAAGAVPTAEPFTRTMRRSVSSPPLRLGIACDVSASMAALAKPVASAAWILARAAAHVPDARSATVVFGESVHPITYPRAVPARVQEFTARARTEEFCDAIDALDAALSLSHSGAARLLVVVSDGHFRSRQRVCGQERIARLTKAGCAVLWLALGTGDTPLDGVHTVTLATPADAIGAIAKAAARALAAST
jgi:hypothetical protein